MSDDADDLLDQLGALEREYDEAYPHEWEDVVRGDRTAEEVAAIRREAGDDPEEIAALAEVLRPVDEAERDAWVDRIAGALDGAGQGDADAPEAVEPEEPATATVVSLSERRSRAPWMAAAVGLLAAAALVLWLRPRGGGESGPGATGLSLPPFSLTVRNETVREIRSGDADPSDVAQYLPTTQVRWIVRPERSVPESLGVRILAEPVSGGERRLLDPKAKVSDRGVIEIRGTFKEVMGLPPGRWSLRMVVGAPPPADLAEVDGGGDFLVVEPSYEVEVLAPEG